MQLPFDKLIPRMLAMAVVVYCLWPAISVFFINPKVKSPKPPPEFSDSLLSPKFPKPPTRNPFVAGVVASDSPAGASTGAGRTQTAGGGAAREGAGAAMPAAPVIPTLDATCIVGDQRLAVIDGRLYAPKDRVPLPGLSPTPFEVISVLPYKVVLKSGDKQLELKYADSDSKPAPADARPPAAIRRTVPARGDAMRKK